MVRKRSRRRSRRVEEDPMAGTSNLVPSQSVQEKMQQQQQTTEVNQGQELNDTPDTTNSSGQGYTEMGKVYKDPSTGKLIMVEG